MNHDQARTQVDRLFTNGLPAPRHARLRDHLRDCDGCRRYYEGVRAVEDAMFAEPTALNDAALGRMAELALDRPPKHSARRVSSWLALFAASATAAAALLFTFGPRETADDRFTARGVADVASAGLTVFHIDRTAKQVTRVARVGATVPSDAVVQLGVTTNDELTHLAVLGVDSTYQVRWYQRPTVVSAGVVDEVVGGAWKLSTPGWLRLFAVFDREPLDGAALEAAAEQLRGANLANRDRLPGVELHQDSILLEVDP